MEPKISVFVRSLCAGSVKIIVEYWSVFKNLRLCAFTLIKSVFKNLRFCGYPLSIAFSKTSAFVAFLCADQCEHFHKNGRFLSVIVQKQCNVNGALTIVHAMFFLGLS